MRGMAFGFATVLALAASGAAAKPWRHGIIEPKSDAGFVLMVKDGGFADRQGLELETVEFQNDTLALHALLAGDIDSYEGGPGTAIVAAAKDPDLRIVGCQWLTVVHSVFARGSIAGAQDLRGQIVAISAPAAMPDLVAKAYLDENHVAARDVRFASLGNDGDRYKALAAGLVAATVISIEFLPLAEPAGFKLLARGGELMPNFLRLCTISTARILAARREDAIRFLAAEMTALRHARANREAELALTRKITGARVDDPRPAFIFAEAARPGGIAPNMPIPLDKLAWMEALLVRVGSLDREFDPKTMVDEELRALALDRAGGG